MGTSSSKSSKSFVPPRYAAAPAMSTGAASSAPASAVPGFFQSPTLKFRAIADRFTSVGEVQDALRRNGLESSNLIIAVDFTKSNEWTGKHSFGGRSLHAIGEVPSPYEDAISAIGKTLSAFDDDGYIPCYGFGDATTGDRAVFSFLADDKPCQGLEQVLWRYRELCPYIRMAGPTSFAPAIRQASRIVEQSGYQYHILLLVADGQVSRSVDMPAGKYSAQEQDTMDAIVEASQLPLSIVMVGVGDGPWELMKDFDDALPERQFDNFQFVNFTNVMASTPGDVGRREALFALRALMEVPEQYQAIQRLGLMGRTSAAAPAARGRRPPVLPPLDPPVPASIRNSCSGASASTPPSGKGSAAAAAEVPVQRPASGTGGAGPSAAASGSASRDRGSQPDPIYLCPITQDVMNDPVIATDGYTYERAVIARWLENKKVSPMTNQPMPGGTALIPNHGLRSSIMQWKQDNGVP